MPSGDVQSADSKSTEKKLSRIGLQCYLVSRFRAFFRPSSSGSLPSRQGLTSPLLSLLGFFFQLPIFFNHHPIQYHWMMD